MQHHKSSGHRKGASSSVHKSKLNDHLVAMKIVDGEMVKLVKPEIEALQSIQSPHVVNLVGAHIGENEREDSIIVTEWMAGGSLQSLIKKKQLYDLLPTHQKQLIALCVVCGVCDLHNENIVHRDIKSDNVLLTSNLHAKIADFGLSRHDSKRTLTPGGTPHYMAPECWKEDQSGQYSVSFSSDVYSVGILLVEIFTGKVPWENLNEYQITGLKVNPDHRFDADKVEELNELEAKNPQLGDLVKRCCSSDPSSRPSIFEVRKDLQNW